VAHDRWTFGRILGLLTLACVGTVGSALGQGIALTGVGPVNRSMGGAAVAAPLDAAGAIYWNPATITGLPASEMTFGFEAILPASRLSSRVEAGALGGGFPPNALSGWNRGEPGVAPVPSFAFVAKPEDSPWTYGLGLFAIGGFSGTYPASLTNPILTPPSLFGVGVGKIAAQLDILQLAPTVSYAWTDRLSIGFAPTLTMARLVADPALFAPPNDADGDGAFSFARATGTRMDWGGGFQVGLFYAASDAWSFGASLKSPQWFEPFRFNSEDELGRPQRLKFGVDYPMIVSAGVAYSGWEDYVVACDVRYFDYANTRGFRSTGFLPSGAVAGLGWDSVFSVSTGIQRRLSERLTCRLGYTFNQNPIGDEETVFNVSSPLIIQHWLAVGMSYQMTANWLWSLAYVHGFHNRIQGPIVAPFGPIAGTSVTSDVWLDAVSLGLTARF
jgi:long-chain fatty acid transport protein